jgi:cytochrome P450
MHKWGLNTPTNVPLMFSTALGLYTKEEIPFCGTTLPKGTDIVVLSRSVSWSSKEVPQGPNNSTAKIFDASRYLVTDPDTGATSSVFPSTKLGGFTPFGHGVRSCPGRTYSEALSYAVLVAVLQAFTWTLTPDHPKVGFVFSIVMVPDCDIQLVLTKRDPTK